MLTILAAAQESGLTLHEILYDMPHDVTAIIVYLMIGLSLYAIWRGSRPKKQAQAPGTTPGAAPPEPSSRGKRVKTP